MSDFELRDHTRRPLTSQHTQPRHQRRFLSIQPGTLDLDLGQTATNLIGRQPRNRTRKHNNLPSRKHSFRRRHHDEVMNIDLDGKSCTKHTARVLHNNVAAQQISKMLS
jgi:hypothetical protein